MRMILFLILWQASVLANGQQFDQPVHNQSLGFEQLPDTSAIEKLAENLAENLAEVPFLEFESLCGENVAARMTDQVITVAERLGEACEKQNEKHSQSTRCPYQTCMTEYRNGGYPAPVMEVKVGNTPTMGGIGGLGGMGSYGGYSSSSSSSGMPEKIYVALLVKFNLMPDPDKIVCTSALSPTVMNQLLNQVMNEVAKTPNCSPK